MNNTYADISCEIIQDILPLYHDEVCSEASKRMIEEHIKHCNECEKVLNALNKTDAFDEMTLESTEVLERHAKREKNVALITGIVIASLLTLPIIIAIMLTLPGYSDWKTNAVLISAMLLVAGLTVVPLVSKQKKFTKTIIASTIALLLVIFFTEIFFDNGGLLRFFEIAFSVIFGISLFFAPFVIKQVELPDVLKNQKGLLTMSWDTVWFYLMIFVFAIAYPASRKDLVYVSTFFVIVIWLIFAIIQYLKKNVFIKAGIITCIIGFWIAIGNYLGWIVVYEYKFHTQILIVTTLAGLLLFVVGIIKNKSK